MSRRNEKITGEELRIIERAYNAASAGARLPKISDIRACVPAASRALTHGNRIAVALRILGLSHQPAQATVVHHTEPAAIASTITLAGLSPARAAELAAQFGAHRCVVTA